MITNTTTDNVRFHAEYKRGTSNGLRVPIDDRGSLSPKDRPTSLGSKDLDWNNGSVNKAVKEMFDFNNGTVNAGDQYNYDNGLMDIETLTRYTFRQSLWGFRGDSRYTTPLDLISFRGYPTADIVSLRYLNVELNKNTSVTHQSLNESISSTSDVIPFQIKKDSTQSFPLTIGADYILISGIVELSQKVPFDSIQIALKQKIGIIDFVTGEYTNMYSGDFDSVDFACKTECFGDGIGYKYYFRMYAECLNSSLDDGNYNQREISIKLSDYNVGSAKDDGIYVSTGLLNSEIISLTANWDGFKWVGDNTIAIDNTPPSKPINLTVDSVVDGRLILNWDDSTDNVGIAYYIVSMRELSGRYNVENLTTVSQIRFFINAGESYDFTVTAVDYAGNKSLVSDIYNYTISTISLQLVYRSALPSSSSQNACGDNTSVPAYVTNSVEFLKGTYTGRVYSDINGTTAFNGQGKYWLFSKYTNDIRTYSMLVTTIGIVKFYNPCVLNNILI